jgi:glutathione S-transferase
MRLYHMQPSRSNRVLFVLEEIGEPYDVTQITREQKEGPEHRERHPLGRVPVVDDGEGYLFETAAICLQLADLHPEKGLNFESGTHERGLVYTWTLFAIAELESPMTTILLTGDDSEAVVEKAKARAMNAAAAVSRALEGREWLVGDRFTVADAMVGAVLGVARRRSLFELEATLNAYVDRIEQRPAYVRAQQLYAPAPA